MSDLHTNTLESSEKFAVYYHSLFDYPLSFSELLRWTPGFLPKNFSNKYEVVYQNGYYFLKGREGLVYQRTLRERLSKKKMTIAQKATRLISIIPSVQTIAVSGSLAMQNADKDSDIDLLIITKSNTLWLSRLVTLILLSIFNIPVRRSGDSNQKDKLCLNVWLDENDSAWSKKERNIYTAHEIAQLIPLVNKDKVFEKFLYQNKWITKFWPKAIRIKEIEDQRTSSHLSLLEKFCFWIQYQHMKHKITNETVTPTKAIFHPKNLSKVILDKISS